MSGSGHVQVVSGSTGHDLLRMCCCTWAYVSSFLPPPHRYQCPSPQLSTPHQSGSFSWASGKYKVENAWNLEWLSGGSRDLKLISFVNEAIGMMQFQR